MNIKKITSTLKDSFKFSSFCFKSSLTKIEDKKNNKSNNIRLVGEDDQFWIEYSNKLKKSAPLESQEVIVNKVIHSWKYSEKHSIGAIELFHELDSIKFLDKPELIPFVLLDIREESELNLYRFPIRNKNKALIPIIEHNLNKINREDYSDIPMNKYLILIDTIGLRSRRAASLLAQEGYLPLYLEGGYDMLYPLIKKYWLEK